MKKVLMMLALMAIPFAMHAQTKFHDVEANEAQGAVKKISQNMMGHDQVTTFTQDGKMQRDGVKDAVYDANGFLQSMKMSFQGQDVTIKYTWKDGKLATQSMDMGGQKMEMEYTDYKYDAKGNWISRKTNMMGQEMEQTRTIEYFE